MTDPNDPAFIYEPMNQKGLTKREYFAAAAMQGLISCLSTELAQSQLRAQTDNLGFPERVVAICALDYADTLIAELSK